MDRDLRTETAKQQARINSVPTRWPEGLTVNEYLDVKVASGVRSQPELPCGTADRYLSERADRQRG